MQTFHTRVHSARFPSQGFLNSMPYGPCKWLKSHAEECCFKGPSECRLEDVVEMDHKMPAICQDMGIERS